MPKRRRLNETISGTPQKVKSTKTTCFGIKVIYNIYKDHLRVLHY